MLKYKKKWLGDALYLYTIISVARDQWHNLLVFRFSHCAWSQIYFEHPGKYCSLATFGIDFQRLNWVYMRDSYYTTKKNILHEKETWHRI